MNAQEVFLEDAGDIRFECHQNHRPFLNSSIAFLSRRHWVGIEEGCLHHRQPAGLEL
jgi:hypothetical protein